MDEAVKEEDTAEVKEEDEEQEKEGDGDKAEGEEEKEGMEEEKEGDEEEDEEEKQRKQKEKEEKKEKEKEENDKAKAAKVCWRCGGPRHSLVSLSLVGTPLCLMLVGFRTVVSAAGGGCRGCKVGSGCCLGRGSGPGGPQACAEAGPKGTVCRCAVWETV